MTKPKRKKGLDDESLLSNNKGKSVKYRLRMQTQQEADDEIREHTRQQEGRRNRRVY
jgi:hypothetical protein